MRGRFWGLWVPAIALVVLLFATDPDGGSSAGMMLSGLASAILAVACAHWTRKVVFDYHDADMQRLFKLAGEGNIGAAIALFGLCIVFCVLLLVFAPRAHAEAMPPNAVTYLPMLKAEQVRGWPDHPAPSVLASLIEQETCISLKHSRCWSPAAKLKTDREEGAGFGQITRAYSAGGGIRFDTIDVARALDPGLAALTWSNVYSRPDLQMRALVAMNHDCFRKITRLVEDTGARLAFCDAAYNGGWGGMQEERRACYLAKGCDAQRWFGNVELHCLKSKVKWKGYGASACDINRDHVENVINKRRPKYKPFFGEV